MKAVLFKSKERFDSFAKKLSEYGVSFTVLDFESPGWVTFDFGGIDFVIYYPSFGFSSNCPLSLYEVRDNLTHLHACYPHLRIYPDPNLIPYYNDKYRQYLFLLSQGYPTPPTIPLLSRESLEQAEKALGYPMVVKNRFGAGGGYVFRVDCRKDLETYFRLSGFDFVHTGSLRFFWNLIRKRIFYWHLIKNRRMLYPFLSYPLLAQKYIEHDHDLKTVVGGSRVVEGHWRRKANRTMWKVNIDGGGVGEWSYIPDEAINLSVRLSRDLHASWINIDLMPENGRFLITEFSPVWHHYAFREKPTFVYKDDYNLDTPLDVSLDLERIIVESLIEDAGQKRETREEEKPKTISGVSQ